MVGIDIEGKKNGKQRISFQKCQDTYNSEGIEYIVETSSGLRTWTTTGVTQVDLNGAGTAGKGMNAGGGMERVLYETSGTVSYTHLTLPTTPYV